MTDSVFEGAYSYDSRFGEGQGTRADLSDPNGLIGEVAQPLLVQRREPD